jgi:agmatinase
VSFDIDVLDRTEASATGTPEPNGLTTQEAMTILQTLMQGVSIGGADLVEVAPFVHHPGIANPEPQTTLKSATEIMTVLTGSY